MKIIVSYIKGLRKIGPRLIRFGFFGGVTTLCSFFLLPLLYQLGMGLEITFCISTVLSITLSHSLQRFFVFYSKAPYFQEYCKFFGSAVGISLYSYVLLKMAVVTEILGTNILYINIVVVTITALTSFSVHSLFTFKKW